MRSCITTLLIIFFLFAVACPCYAKKDFDRKGLRTFPQAKWVPNEIVVKFKPDLSDQHINRINRRHRTSVLYTSGFAGFKRIKVPAGKTAKQIVQLYKDEPGVKYAELNYYAYAMFVPNQH